MKLSPNLLLAAATSFALAVVVLSASVFSPDRAAMYVCLALVCIAAFLSINRLLLKRRNRRARVLISREQPVTAVWASLFPLLVLSSAALPMLAPGGDYGLMIIIGAIWTGVTIQSAMAERQTP